MTGLGAHVMTPLGPGRVVDVWTDPETIRRPARAQPVVQLKDGRRRRFRIDQPDVDLFDDELVLTVEVPPL